MNLSEKANNYDNKFNVALDGPSAAGKGLLGSLLAEEYNLKYVQSSIVYRGLAFVCIEDRVDPEDTDKVIELSLSEDVISRVAGIDLNQEHIGEVASIISVIPEVRENLGLYLKKLIETTPRIVMEGRDIGTVVAPDADLKIFITADVNVRAERRYKQLRGEGKECILNDVLSLLRKRDERDISRSAAPLKPAQDALVIDTSNLEPNQVIKTIKDFVANQPL